MFITFRKLSLEGGPEVLSTPGPVVLPKERPFSGTLEI